MTEDKRIVRGFVAQVEEWEVQSRRIGTPFQRIVLPIIVDALQVLEEEHPDRFADLCRKHAEEADKDGRLDLLIFANEL